MANPLLTDSTFKRASGTALPPPDISTRWDAPAVTARRTDVMTVNGTIQATLGMLALLLAGGYVGWRSVEVNAANEVTKFPTWTLALVLVGFGLVMVSSFKPHLARILAPIYAVAEGVFLGAISHAYESYQDGIVLAALGATLGVFAVMLLLYRFRIIKVTQRLRSVVLGATIGLGLFYLVAIIANAFGNGISIINSASGLGIAFSIFAAGLAAFNLLLDFDFIERGSRADAPAYMNWFAALGLVVTLVWLYLELLRLLSKLQRR
jgi:uncharacterized YccA/Bax inhibitor family protein